LSDGERPFTQISPLDLFQWADQHGVAVGTREMVMRGIELVWEVGWPITESPVFDPLENCVFFRSQRPLEPGVKGAQILRFGAVDESKTIYEMPDRVGSLGLCRSGRIVVALDRQIVIFTPRTGEISPLTRELDEPVGNQFNDGKVGPDGCFWVGTADGRRRRGRRADGNGVLYRVTPTGDLEPKADGFVCSNGLAWSPEGTRMYQSDSTTGVVNVWDFEPRSGEITNRRLFAHLSVEDGLPDGAACDVDGNYWSAGVSAGCLNKFAPNGDLIDKINLPCPAPTMPCFAGDTLYFTSLDRRVAPDEFDDQPARNPLDVSGLFSMPAPNAGAPIGLFADRYV
jgi:sugar lactone lactonase YvrE